VHRLPLPDLPDGPGFYKMDMSKLTKGDFCGKCHNGQKSFDVKARITAPSVISSPGVHAKITFVVLHAVAARGGGLGIGHRRRGHQLQRRQASILSISATTTIQRRGVSSARPATSRSSPGQGYEMKKESITKRDFCSHCHNGMKGFDAASAKNCARCHKK